MSFTWAGKRMAKKAAVGQEYHTEGDQHHRPVSRDRPPPSAPGALNSPAKSDAPQPSPESDTTFSSREWEMRRPSVASCDDADAFQGAPMRGPGDLVNPIHPLFRRENCHGEARQRYDVLLPAFQLASRFLQTESLLPFWYTLFFSKVEEIENPWYAGGGLRSYEYLDTPETLSEAQVEQTKNALVHLSDRIRFTIVPGGEGSSHYITRRRNGDGRIFISRNLFRSIREAIKQRDGPRWTWLMLHLSTTVLHEFAHAVEGVWRPGDHHYYFPNRIASEVGFELEQQLLGGILNWDYAYQRQPNTDVVILLAKWPNACHVGEYLSSGARFGVREKPHPGDIYDAEAGTVPLAWIKQLFRESLWAVVETQGAKALRMPFVDMGRKLAMTEEWRYALLGLSGGAAQRNRRFGMILNSIDFQMRRQSTGDLEVSKTVGWDKVRRYTR